MDDAGYQLKLSSMAERNLYHEIIWLEENRSVKQALDFEAAFQKLLQSLSAQPFRWQKQVVSGRIVRRAILQKRWIVLYTVNTRAQTVTVLALRGAAEDWTNQPLPV